MASVLTDANQFTRRATRLLLAVAEGADGSAREYDTLLYPLVLAMVKKRGRLLAVDAARLTGTDGMGVPLVPDCDREWVANDVTVHALERARAQAARFDPARGDGASWALRQASFSYVDVVRTAYGSRRSLTVLPQDIATLTELVDSSGMVSAGPEAVVEARAALDAALSALNYQERFVILATLHYGLSYAETAELLLADSTMTKRIDRLLQAARRKLAAAETTWRDGG